MRRRLDYLQRLGVGTIWLSPVLQNCQAHDSSYHGYGIQHFLTVDPRFASDKSDPDGELPDQPCRDQGVAQLGGPSLSLSSSS